MEAPKKWPDPVNDRRPLWLHCCAGEAAARDSRKTGSHWGMTIEITCRILKRNSNIHQYIHQYSIYSYQQNNISMYFMGFSLESWYHDLFFSCPTWGFRSTCLRLLHGRATALSSAHPLWVPVCQILSDFPQWVAWGRNMQGGAPLNEMFVGW